MSQQKSERRQLRPDDLHRGRVHQREKMSALLVCLLSKFLAEYTPAIVDRPTENAECHKTPFLALGVDPSPCLFVFEKKHWP